MAVIILEIPSDLSTAEQQIVTTRARAVVREFLARRDARKARLAQQEQLAVKADRDTARLFKEPYR